MKSIPVKAAPCDHMSTDIRKIDNGYVTRHSHSANGEYHSREEFSKERPMLSPAAPAPDMRNSMERAVDHIANSHGRVRTAEGMKR